MQHFDMPIENVSISTVLDDSMQTDFTWVSLRSFIVDTISSIKGGK